MNGNVLLLLLQEGVQTCSVAFIWMVYTLYTEHESFHPQDPGKGGANNYTNSVDRSSQLNLQRRSEQSNYTNSVDRSFQLNLQNGAFLRAVDRLIESRVTQRLV